MVEKLTIKNFGPIKDVSLDLRAVNIFIGDQGTGKSTVAKLLAVIKGALNDSYPLPGQLKLTKNGEKIDDEVGVIDYIEKNFAKSFEEYMADFDISNYFNSDSFIYFDNSFCEVTINKGEVILNRGNSIDKKNTNTNYYIPSYRDAFILLRDKYPGLQIANVNLPFLLNKFGQEFLNYKTALKYFDFKKIIGVEYRYTNEQEGIVIKNGKKIRFEEASSAISSVVPMLVVFLGIIDEMSAEKGRVLHRANCPFITIEEPELNCFPETQKKLVEFLISNIKFKDYEKSGEFYSNLLVTTHSPYVLTSLNNLMYSYEAGKKHEKEVNDIIDKKYWMNPNEVSAYMMLPDGTCEDIMDREENLIKADKIDGVSSIINEEFNRIIDIELGVQHEKD
jgi:predicted ATPase